MILKNIQVIDGADNCTYSIFAASERDFKAIFPSEGQDIEFAEDFFLRVGKPRAKAISKRLWLKPVQKKEVQGINGTLYYELGFKKRYYPTKREAEMVTGIGLKENRDPMMTDEIVINTDLPLKRFISGKVRDTYDLGEYLLIVVTDRISAFDVVLPAGIPDKGKVLNLFSAFWFDRTRNIIPNHVVAVIEDVKQLDKYVPEKQRFDYPIYLEGRSMVVKKVKRLPVECVVRGYLAGSGWSEYKKRQSICGVALPAGLRQSEILEEPIFTPTTKGDNTHDLPMTYEEVEKEIGKDLALKLKTMSIALYAFARDYARHHDIIIADTKFEFGLDADNLILIDEALTPDSSRFWDEKLYKVGEPQDSYDKQPLRDWLEQSGWNKEPPAPALPPEVIESTRRRYVHAFEVLTGKKLP